MLKFCTGGKNKKEQVEYRYSIYNSTEITNLNQFPYEYIEVYDITNLERYSIPKNQWRNPPILVGKPKNFVKICVKINFKPKHREVCRQNNNTFCVVCKILLSFLLHRTHHA